MDAVTHACSYSHVIMWQHMYDVTTGFNFIKLNFEREHFATN